MPYNTTAIPPRKEVTGQTQLPLTRVKKIIAVDPDINICSNNAAFVITLATVSFLLPPPTRYLYIRIIPSSLSLQPQHPSSNYPPHLPT